ncbi:MAG: ABC transporter substrate-binding protein, partial [Coriobacteriia bacterium]|nr:ABC transporter substrate-binding protein [Coriobacteriia bacterium]
TAMQAIQAGEVNAWAATATQVEQMNVEGSGLVVHPYSENRVIYAMFNAQNVTDENIRKAFFFSLDRPTLALAACLSPDYYEEDVSFLPANNAFATTDIETYARNVDKAKELLAQAGQANPSISISYGADDTMRQTIAILMQEQASEAGFNVTLNALETNALNGKLLSEENDLQVFLGGYVNGIDPDTYFATFGTTATYNFMHYDEPEIDELFAQGRTEADEAKRKEIYAQLQAKVADTGCFYPMFTDKRLLVTTANVTGVDEAKLVPVYTFGDMSKLDIEA